MSYFSDKVIWITGASSGIGKALSELLYEQGGKLILTSRNREKLDTIAEQLSTDRSERIKVLEADLSLESDYRDLCDGAVACYGPIDILINNAGISQRSTVVETEISVYRKLITLDYLTPVALIRNLLPGMIKEKRGQIVNISSVASRVHTPLRSGYSGAKAALNAFSDALSAEISDTGIIVTTVIPGFIKTDISLNSLTGLGESYNVYDDNQVNGISSRDCALTIAAGLEKKKREILVGFNSKLHFAHFMSKYFPSLLSKILSKAKVT